MDAKNIELSVPKDVWILCELFDITPQQLLEQYMQDLCSMPGNGGSDERYMAKGYLLRTYLPMQTDFGTQHAEEILEDFETLYQSAYPCVGNPDHKEQRAKLLSELFRTWRDKKRSIITTTGK